jgi:hypothetical protein
MLVPLNDAQVPSRAGTEDRISTPGAATSGLSCSDRGVGPADENDASSGRRSGVTAATVIARAALPGEVIEPPPNSA